MRIVIPDAQTVTKGDVSLDALSDFGELTVYPLSKTEELPTRLAPAEAIICNKALMNAETLKHAENLRYIGLFATGYNNIDLDYCRKNGITVCNAGSYSTDAVAQHTFALILELFSKVGRYDAFTAAGGWKSSPTFSPFVYSLNELAGKTIGIVGGGSIGTAVAKIALAFNMRVLINSRTKRDFPYGSYASLEDILRLGDVVTVHCPLNADSAEMFNAEAFAKMKDGAIFINTARGGVICEQALADALNSGKLGGAGIDVLQTEPMADGCVLLGAKNCIITPHIAWAPIETRERLINTVYENLKAFVGGAPQNVVGV